MVSNIISEPSLPVTLNEYCGKFNCFNFVFVFLKPATSEPHIASFCYDIANPAVTRKEGGQF